MRITKDKGVSGLFIRHGVRGGTYIYARNVKGKMIRASLGSVAEHTPEEARRWALSLNEQNGQRRLAGYTLGEVCDKAAERARSKGRRQPEYLKYWAGLYSTDWFDRPIAEITKGMISVRQDKIAASRGGQAAARWIMVLNIHYTFADKNLDYEGRNPARGIEKAPRRARQVVWTEEQVSGFLAAARTYDSTLYWHDFFLIIARTGMRRGNLCKMEWTSLDAASRTWTIPAHKFKTGVAHTVHLVEEVMTALARRRDAVEADCPWVFPSLTHTGKPLTDPYRSFARICKAAEVSGVTIHDLRRTLGSRLAARVPLPVVAKVLGHRTLNTTMRRYAVIADEEARAALMSL